MDGGASGYITDLVYPGLFHRETSPVWIAMAAAAIGQQAPDLARPFRYLDLGCGVGLNTALLAAANPHARFIGVDINPDHIAQGDLHAACLPNLTFVQAGFDAVAEGRAAGEILDAPFDFIVAHGVYSWIAPERQAALRRIVERCLAPGGLVYLHYTSHPGHSVFAGAQAMMRRIAAVTPGTSRDRLTAAIACLRALEAGGAGYLRSHPAVGEMLFRGDGDAAALAHDLLAPDWAALHAGDVMEDMEAAGCAFLGSASVLDNIDALSVPGAAQGVIAGIGDLKARETARDLARNQSVRRDLYRKGLRGLPAHAYRAQLEGMRYHALPAMCGAGELVIAMPIGPVSVDAMLVDPLRAHLRRSPATFGELVAAHPSRDAPGALLRALLMLVAAGEVHAAPALAPQDGGEALRLNRMLSAQGEGAGWLAAPAIGSAIPVSREECAVAAALLLDAGGEGEALLRAARRYVPALAQEDMASILGARAPLWRALGVIPA